MKLVQSDTFRKWLGKLRDERARGLIAARLYRLSDGHVGDVQGVGDGISEMRVHHGPGYRIYFHREGDMIILLLCGGDKSSQVKDIGLAKRLLTEWRLKNG